MQGLSQTRVSNQIHLTQIAVGGRDMLLSLHPCLPATPPSPPHLPRIRMLARSASKVFSSLIPSSSKTSAFQPTLCPCLHFSSKSPYPFYYELISYSPAPRPARRRQDRTSVPHATNHSDVDEEPEAPLPSPADKAKRKYYRKLEKRMYGGSDSDDARARAGDEEPVELQPEVIEFRTLHSREEELFFHDTFAMPWEKDKHYRMVYQLEKKYFPDQCLDKAFEDPEPAVAPAMPVVMGKGGKGAKGGRGGLGKKAEEGRDEKGLIFFDEEREKAETAEVGAGVTNISERKVEEFLKCIKKVPNLQGTSRGDVDLNISAPAEPFFSSRKSGLPPRWDGPSGTVVLINKPKGWTSFTVCGRLRRLVKVQKVGHAGTLDPMATGLLIVCVGKATKIVDRYQGMIKGYSGIFRLGEATSTWDADSPVIQREPWEHIKDEEIRKAAASFCGEIWQVPPMFSAIKVGGEKMYDKARRGETVELSPRRISIFQFDIERSLDDRQNLIFRVICSKGTYIRSLCADLGKALGSCAHLTALRRDSIGEYLADEAWDFQELQQQITKSYL